MAEVDRHAPRRHTVTDPWGSAPPTVIEPAPALPGVTIDGDPLAEDFLSKVNRYARLRREQSAREEQAEAIKKAADELETELLEDFSAAAVQNLLIAATSLGLATVWLGVLVLIKNDILRFLGEPEGEFMAVVPVGYAAKPSSNGPQKQPLDMVVKSL